VSPIENIGLFERCWASLVQKVPEIVAVEVGENQDFVTRWPRLSRLDQCYSTDSNPGRLTYPFDIKRLKFSRLPEFSGYILVIKSHGQLLDGNKGERDSSICPFCLRPLK
jgi:hypothetical protein